MYKYSNSNNDRVDNLATGERGIHPSVWKWQDYLSWVSGGGITEAFDTRTPAEIAADEQKIAVESQRRAGVEASKQTIGLKVLTVAQAEAWIDARIDAGTTTAQKLEAIRTIFKKMIPYLLD